MLQELSHNFSGYKTSQLSGSIEALLKANNKSSKKYDHLITYTYVGYMVYKNSEFSKRILMLMLNTNPNKYILILKCIKHTRSQFEVITQKYPLKRGLL